MNNLLQKWTPHGHCFNWEPDVLWMNVLGDLGTAIAYTLIPIFLIVWALKQEGFWDAFKAYFLLVVGFSVFIFSCGNSHEFDILVTWIPFYRLQAIHRVLLAGISLSVALYLLKFRKTRLRVYKRGDRLAADIELPSRKIRIVQESK